jgi:hypothetical protein
LKLRMLHGGFSCLLPVPGVGVLFGSPYLLIASFSGKTTMSDDKGNVMGGFPLSEREHKGIEIADKTIQELRVKGSKCLVGRLGVPKKLNKEAFKAILIRIWRSACNLIFNEIHENL